MSSQMNPHTVLYLFVINFNLALDKKNKLYYNTENESRKFRMNCKFHFRVYMIELDQSLIFTLFHADQ